MVKVSIVVPVYGVEQYIERCSHSLFRQTYHNLEYVFVNDCSPDRSIEVLNRVLERYPERREDVKIVSHESNKGLASSRNTGLDNSTGEFVFCVDSDDWLELDAIESLVDRQGKGDFDIVSGGYLVHYFDGEQHLWARHYEDKREMVLQLMQRTWDHFVAGRLVRRSLFFNNGLHWNDGLDVAEDRYMMTLLAYFARSFDSVDKVVYHYDRRNTTALTKINGGRNVLRNNRQELGNVLLLEQFFKDKDTIYRKGCTHCLMEQLVYNLRATVTYSAKEDYYDLIRIIDSRSDADFSSIGWKKCGVRAWARHHYSYMLMLQKRDRAIRFLKKRLRALFS